MTNLDGAVVISGNGNPELGKAIVAKLGISLGAIKLARFADGEINLEILESIRGRHVFIIQPTCVPVNENLMELLLMISTCRRGSAGKVTAVVPYFGYARQDRKTKSRVPISAADVACLISAMCPNRVISIDLHCGQIQGFFPPNVAVDNLEAIKIGIPIITALGLKNPIVLSPDAGSVGRAQKFLDFLRPHVPMPVGFAIINKQRKVANEIADMKIVGDVSGGDVIIIDDMIDTAGTLSEAAKHIKMHGANSVYAFATHGLFSGPAVSRIEASPLTKVIVTDTAPPSEAVKACNKICFVSIAGMLANAISHVHHQESVASILKNDDDINAL